MTDQPLEITAFLKLILKALEASKIKDWMGGNCGMGMEEPRATQDLDIVIILPVNVIGRFSRELEKRNMLVPADIILDAMRDAAQTSR